MPKARTARSPRKATLTDERIGSLIRAQRRTKGLSLTDLGNAIGVAHQQVQKYETGLNRVPSARLEQIAKALDMSLSNFFEGGADREGEIGNLELMRSAPALRLLRAFKALKSRSARYRVLEMVEKMARK